MNGAVLILRPQPGADETASRARVRDLEPVVTPLFAIRPLDWTPPPVDQFDAVLVTSANAPRHGGPGLAAFTGLPCYAVGEATAAAAREAGFTDIRIGPFNAAAVVRMMADDGIKRAFHPCSLEAGAVPDEGVALDQVAVYAPVADDRLSDIAIAALNAGAVVLLHSPHAAATFADLVGERRATTRIAAISDAAADAAGFGWAGTIVAEEPRDDALLAAAELLWTQERPRAEPAPPPPPEPADEPVETVQPRRRRPWVSLFLLVLIAFLVGIGAMLWLLHRWEGSAEMLGIVPQQAPAVTAPAPQPEPQSPARTTPSPTADGGTIVIDPDVARRVALLEQRIGEIDVSSRSAVGNADRAEGLLVAFAARRALDNGVGLGYLENLLRQRFGATQPQAVGTIIAASRSPVILQQLQEELQTTGPSLLRARPDEGLLEQIRSELANLVIIRRAGTDTTEPRERLRRATSWLEAGRVEQALAEVLRMPGAANGASWIDAARRYIAARQALDTIEVAALLEPRMPAAPPPQAPPAPEPDLP